METRAVNVTYPHRSEGQPCRVILTHRPTGLSAEGVGEDFDAAKAQAWAALEKEVGE